MINNLKYSIEVEGWVKPHIPPSHKPKGETEYIRPCGSNKGFGFTKLRPLILIGLSVYKTNVHLHSLSRLYNKLIVYTCILLHQTNVYCGVYHKQTTLVMLDEYNYSDKVFTPCNVYVCAVDHDSCISYFLELVQFRGILGLFGLFLPNMCEGKQMKQIHL